MTTEQVLQVVSRYRTYLSLVGDEAKPAPFDLPPTRGETIRHMLHMCDQIEGLVYESDGYMSDKYKQETWEKANRWLGFMQGVLWAHGSFTLNEMRGHNTCSLSS